MYHTVTYGWDEFYQTLYRVESGPILKRLFRTLRKHETLLSSHHLCQKACGFFGCVQPVTLIKTLAPSVLISTFFTYLMFFRNYFCSVKELTTRFA